MYQLKCLKSRKTERRLSFFELYNGDGDGDGDDDDHGDDDFDSLIKLSYKEATVFNTTLMPGAGLINLLFLEKIVEN